MSGSTEKRVPLSQMGAGFSGVSYRPRQPRSTMSPAFIFIHEPELHLHPCASGGIVEDASIDCFQRRRFFKAEYRPSGATPLTASIRFGRRLILRSAALGKNWKTL